MAGPPDGKRRVDLLPPINPPPSSRLAGCPTARATWGDVCSPARRILVRWKRVPVWNL